MLKISQNLGDVMPTISTTTNPFWRRQLISASLMFLNQTNCMIKPSNEKTQTHLIKAGRVWSLSKLKLNCENWKSKKRAKIQLNIACNSYIFTYDQEVCKYKGKQSSNQNGWGERDSTSDDREKREGSWRPRGSKTNREGEREQGKKTKSRRPCSPQRAQIKSTGGSCLRS